VSDEFIIGRDTELAQLEEALSSARPGLVLLVGKPATGKGRLVRELRKRAASYPRTLVPADPSSDGGAPWLVVNKQSTVEDFRRATVPSNEAAITMEASARPRPELVLVYGYRPEEDFHRWFAGEFLPGLAVVMPPRVVVVAGSAEEVAGLEPLAYLKVVLEALPRETVIAEFRRFSAGIEDKLEERELEIYADAIVADLSLFNTLCQLLSLTPAQAPSPGSL
jgi:hypothetical protein